VCKWGVGALALGGRLTKSVAAWHDPPMCIQWGTVGEWAGAIGSTLVAVVAICIARRDGRRAQEIADRVDAGRVWIVPHANATDLYGDVANHSTVGIHTVAVQAGNTWQQGAPTHPLGRIHAGAKYPYTVPRKADEDPLVVVRFTTDTGLTWEVTPGKPPRLLSSKTRLTRRRRPGG